MADLEKEEWLKYPDEDEAKLCLRASTALRKGISRDELMAVYDDWADVFEEEVEAGGAQGPTHASAALAEEYKEGGRRDVRVLDVGAGTGLAAVALRKLGFDNIDALDPSEAMLNYARERDRYREYLCTFLTGERLPVENDTYDAITAVGCFTEGHVPCEALHEMVRIVKPGGVIVIVTRFEYLQMVDEYKDRLEPLMDRLEEQGKWQKLSRTVGPKYYMDKEAIIWKYKVL